MTEDLNNVLHRRMAIQRGLQHYFQGPSLDQVIGYWEQEYSEKPSFVLNRFLSEICTTDELKQYRKEMLRQVLHELTLLEKGELASNHFNQVALNSNEQHHAYHAFISKVLSHVPATDETDFFIELRQQLVIDRVLNSKQRERFTNSLEMMMKMLATDYAKTITSLYQTYCHFYGPLKTDQIYAKTKLLVKQDHPEADLHYLL